MIKIHIQYFIVGFLIALGVVTIFNFNTPMSDWSWTSKAITTIIALLIYHNTIKHHNPNGHA